jgi:mannose/fructose/N-acetylgalactosamine-specific phosphotransferase system component IIC
MAKIRELIPLKLLIAAAVLIALSFIATPVLSSWVPDLQSSKNALLLALPFLMVFVPIILLFMALIVFVSKILHQRVPERAYKSIEYVFIVGIVAGIISMFQPWTFLLFKPGFFILFGSLLGFMIWSHVGMKRERR